jgi:hypothetical protein
MQSEEGRAIEYSKWQPLNREQTLAARDFSRAGETFIDHNNQVNEILYATLTPLGYQAYISVYALEHIEKHPIASKHKNEISYILSNPDLVTPNPDNLTTHIFYKSYGKILLAVAVQVKNEVRFVATMYDTEYIKGLKQKRLLSKEFLYLRGGFKWKKWR